MFITSQQKTISFKSIDLCCMQKQSADWVVISRGEYRRLNVFQGLLLFILLGLLPGLVWANSQVIDDNVKTGVKKIQKALNVRIEEDVFKIDDMVAGISVKPCFKKD